MNWVNKPLLAPTNTRGFFIMKYKLEQRKSPRERVLELLDKIIVDELQVESISIERFKAEHTGKAYLQVSLELTEKWNYYL